MLIILVLLLVCVKNTNKYKAIKSLQCLHFERGLKKNEMKLYLSIALPTPMGVGRWGNGLPLLSTIPLLSAFDHHANVKNSCGHTQRIFPLYNI